MERFDCNGQLIVHINVEICRAKIQLKHFLQHERPSTSGNVPREVVTEIST